MSSSTQRNCNFIEIIQNEIKYSINENEKVASVIKIYTDGDVYIPRSIYYNSNEYLVTTICTRSIDGCREVKSIQFSEDSSLFKIEQQAFYNCAINSISLPSSVCELEKDWIYFSCLSEIKVSSENMYFKSYENRLLLAKSSKEKENFDVLINSITDINKLVIPDFIEIISTSSFSNDTKINTVQFSSKSKLRKIEKGAFSFCEIGMINIPASCVELVDGWFDNINEIEIDPKNENYKLYDNKMIIGKSTKEKTNFDVLVFCSRNATEIIIPDFIEIIGSGAFYECRRLKKIIIPANTKLKIIGKKAFRCSKIDKISIPSKVTKIGDWAFSSCYELHQIEIPNDSELQIIGEHAFYEVPIETIFIPSQVTQIKNNAFDSCSELKTIQFSENSKLEKIGKKSFNSTSIESITLPASVIDFDKDSFFTSRKPIKVFIDPKNSRIKLYDNKIIIAKTSKEKENFDIICSCISDVKNVTIPDFIEKIGPYCFNSIIRVVIFPPNSKVQIIDEFSFYSSSIETISLPSSVTHIKSFAFESCKKLKKIEIPNDSNLQIIEKGSFKKSGIINFYVPSQLTQIEERVFESCENLQYIEFHPKSNIKIIGEKAFFRSGIKSITIPASVIELKRKCFLETFKLDKIEVDSNNQYFKSFENKIILGKSSIGKEYFDSLVFYNTLNITEITIPDSVEIICSSAFKNNNKIQKVNFSFNSKLHVIRKSAFKLSSIKSITFPPQLTKVEDEAFSSCRSLQTVEIPSNCELKIIGYKAFFGTAIEKICIPSQLTHICKSAFENCENLQKVEIAKNSKLQVIEEHAFSETLIESFTIPSSTEELKEECFYNMNKLKNIEVDSNCKNYLKINDKIVVGKSSKEKVNFDVLVFCDIDATTVTIPSSVEIIYSYAFLRCDKLQEVIISSDSNLKIIGNSSFANIPIKKITIPEKVTIIGKYAFSRCYQLQSVKISSNSQLQKIQRGAFFYTNIKYFFIPSTVELIGMNAFNRCKSLRFVEIPVNSNLEIIGGRAFQESSIEAISIPKSIKFIGEESFESCTNLKRVNFAIDSELEEIPVNCFNGADIKGVMIPSRVKILNFGSFKGNYNLQYITFQEDSRLQEINSDSLCCTKIKSFSFPPKLSFLNKDSIRSRHLQIIEINDYSNLQCFNKKYVYPNSDVIIMISAKIVDRFDLNLESEINKKPVPDISMKSIPDEIKQEISNGLKQDNSNSSDQEFLGLDDLFG